MTFKADTSCQCSVRSAVNFGDRDPELEIDILLLHYTGMESGEAAIDWLCCEESGVSCHYVVNEDGEIVQLVPEAKRAWHAGKSCWQNIADTNSRSIGIEIVNPGHHHGYPDFPVLQVDAVIELSKDIVSRHSIPARNVLAHSDVAPGRKMDPGEKFPWQKLHHAGIGLWVDEEYDPSHELKLGDQGDGVARLQSDLLAFGYCLDVSGVFDSETRECIRAFQMHFYPARVDGIADQGLFNALKRLIYPT
jgi:N-acetylmuramoyl-L-alanine amidase